MASSPISAVLRSPRGRSAGRQPVVAGAPRGRAIAGVIIIKSAVPRLWLAGIRDSSMAYRRMGAVGATTISRAGAGGGGLQADGLVAAGLFQRRRDELTGKWNHRLDGFGDSGTAWCLRCWLPARRRGFARAPAVAHLQDGRLHGAVFVDDAHSPPAESAAKEVSLRALAGLAV